MSNWPTDLQRSKRGAAKRSQQFTYNVEGEYLTMPQIAERLGVSHSTARSRHLKATAPITWEKLK